jgi:UDP-glucose 4-epimerase
MKKVIVFGANGYLARNLISFLLENEYELEVFDLQESSIDNYSFYKCLDIRNKEETSNVDFNVDNVFLFSALTGTKIGFEQYDEFISTNEIGTLNIINAIKNSNSSARIIFPSTRLVYKGIKNKLLNEESQQEIKTIYAANKIFIENILKIYSELYNIKYTIFRICIPYDSIINSDYSYGTIGYFISKASKREDIVLYGNGELKRTFTNVFDIVNIMHKSINTLNTVNSTYNIGGETFSLNEIAQKIANLYNVNVTFIDWPEIDKQIETGDTIFDSSKIDECLNYFNYSTLQNWFEKLKVLNKK